MNPSVWFGFMAYERKLNITAIGKLSKVLRLRLRLTPDQ
jgi:hypothetical protein